MIGMYLTVVLEYLSTKIILNAADTTLGDTLVLTEADTSGLTTSDGGETWTVSMINIHAYTFDITN